MIHTMIVNVPDGGMLNMRELPSKSSDIIAKIPNGTPVGVVGEKEGWMHLNYFDQMGWVMGRYLTEPRDDPQGQVIVDKSELKKVYDKIGNWLGMNR